MAGSTQGGSVAVVRTQARFDSNSAPGVEAEVRGLIEGGARRMVCDLGATDYVSSAALRVLLATARELQRGGGELVLCAPRAYVMEVLETAGFTRLLKIFDTEAKASEYLAQQG
jgi:anti-anti-sigma factor